MRNNVSTIDNLRAEIKALDKSIIAILAQRQHLCLEIGKLKSNQSVAVEDLNQEKMQFDNYRQWSSDYNVRFELVSKLFELIIKESKQIQSNRRG